MPRKLICALVVLVAGALPQAALAKRHHHHAKKACHGHHCVTKRSATRGSSLTSDPTTQLPDPTTQLPDPTTQLPDPTTQLPAPGNPAQACRAERDDDAEGFAEHYGTNHNKRNAFGKCVSAHAHEQGDDDEGDEPESDD